MKQKIYTIFDTIADTAGPIWTAQNDKVAKRNFQYHLSEIKMAQPDDFKLYCVGEFSFNEMHIEKETPRRVTLEFNDAEPI